MSEWLGERIHRLELSIGRIQSALVSGRIRDPATRWFLRKESSFCLRRAIALWWGLRWGRR